MVTEQRKGRGVDGLALVAAAFHLWVKSHIPDYFIFVGKEEAKPVLPQLCLCILYTMMGKPYVSEVTYLNLSLLVFFL